MIHNGKRLPRKFTDSGRVEVLYLHQIHKISMRKIAKKVVSSYGAVRNAIILYQKWGTTSTPEDSRVKDTMNIFKVEKKQASNGIFVTLQCKESCVEWPVETLSIRNNGC